MPQPPRREPGPPPTIGYLRGQGVTGARIYCGNIRCARSVVVAFDAMGLPDATAFPDIPRRRRWVCSRCGSREVRAIPDWQDPRKVQAARIDGGR